MRRLRVGPIVAALALSIGFASPVLADTNASATPSPAATVAAPGVGAVAPKAVLQSVIDGKPEAFDLQAAAAKRPIVLYFFPKAFTAG